MTMFVRFWGTRGSIPTPGHKTRKYGGNTACVEIRIDDVLFICDGGTGLRELGVDLTERGVNPIQAHMLFSHTHWDHIQGFPFFPPAYGKSNSLFVYDVAEDDNRVHRLLRGQMRAEYFPVSFTDLGARIVPRNLTKPEETVDGVTIGHFELKHPGRCFAFSLARDGRKVVYATDHEIDLTLLNRDDVEANPSEPRQIPPEFLDFVRGADLLIADGQFTDEEYTSKVGWGHARATSVVDLAVQANVKQLAIFHHDPMQSDAMVDRKITTCRERAKDAGSSVVVFGAREGLEIKIE